MVGSFNPFHTGHLDIAKIGMWLFDEIIVGVAQNPDKTDSASIVQVEKQFALRSDANVVEIKGLVVDYIKEYNAANNGKQIVCIIKGLRNATDMQNEQAQQYWNEDLGLTIPIIYTIASRDKTHISSSAIRQIDKFKKG